MMTYILSNPRRLVGSIAFTCCYLSLVAWFSWFDPYRRLFWESGAVITAYNVFRLCYVVFLGWIVSCLGFAAMIAMKGRGAVVPTRGLDTIILSFYLGAAIAAIILFVMGYLNLYYAPVFVVLTSCVVFFSYPLLQRAIVAIYDRARSIRGKGVSGVYACAMTFLVLVALYLLFLVTAGKGLLPGGGHDYYTHYFPYYIDVVKNHGIWPNDAWYHYYYSKGAGLVFLSMLLTDPLAPQLITLLFFVLSSLVLFSLIRKISDDYHWPMVAVVLYLAAFVWTPGCGEFEKQHVLMGSLIVSIVWMGCLTCEHRDAGLSRAWLFIWFLLLSHLLLFSPTVFSIMLPFMVISLLPSFLARGPFSTKALAALILGSVALFLVILAINYLTTGMAEITPFRTFWRFADQSRLSRWVSPYLMLVLSEGSSPSMGQLNAPELLFVSTIDQFTHYFRLWSIKFLFLNRYVVAFLVATSCIALALRRSNYNRTKVVITVPVIIFSAVALLNAVLLNVNQTTSLWRYYIFSVFFTVAIGVIIWRAWFSLVTPVSWRKFSLVVSLCLTVVVSGWSCMDAMKRYPRSKAKLASSFASGRISIGEAYRANGGISPNAQDVCKAVGPDRRVWSFTIINYSMLPECVFETAISFALRDSWHQIMFESAETSRKLLQRQGLNYFLVDLKTEIFDFFPFTSLFSPEGIEKHLGVVWNKDSTYLLSWLGPETTPLPADFTDTYRTKITTEKSSISIKEIYDRVRLIYESNRGRPYPIYRDPKLPPIKGWQ